MGAVSRILPQTWHRPIELTLLMGLTAEVVAKRASYKANHSRCKKSQYPVLPGATP
jgi:hypothetical protein